MAFEIPDENLEVLPAPLDYDENDPDALRRRVRQYAEANSCSIKSVGLLCGVNGESTFQAWLGGKYRGNNESIEEKVRIWARNERHVVRKKSSVPDALRFVQTRAAKKFLNTLEHAQVLADIVVITGGAGVGKTSAILEYKATHPNVWHLTAEPLVSGAFAMIEYLRETLGVPQTAPHKLSRAISLKVAGTQGLIIIDEAQHLETKAIDQLRSINDRCGIGIAFVGNEEVWSRIDGGGRKAEFAQLFSRVGMRVNVPRASAKDIEALLDGNEVIEPGQRKQLKYIASLPGALRAMGKTLRDARMMASGAQEELTEKHIESAFNLLSGRVLEGQ